jgi:alpha-glucoside transport system substrate-binding protein
MKSKNTWYWLGIVVVLVMVLSACASQATEEPVIEAPVEAYCDGVTAGDQITVMYQWSGAEEEKINAVLKPFVDACGVEIVAETTRDDAVLDTRVKSTPPDILFWPNVSPLSLYTDKLMPLDSLGAVADNYASYWLDFGSVDGNWYAVPMKADPKTMIWYSPAQFEVYGYTVPTTMDELDALVEQMVSDGLVPWSMGFKSEGADGWAGSDFIQDLLLAQQGPDYVKGLISGDITYDDAGVVAAYEIYAKWASSDTYTVGGATGTVETGFLDAIYKVFQPEPEAMMVKQSGFAGGEVKTQFPDLEYGVDYDFFMFPDAKGLQGGADYLFAFGGSPAAKALVTYLTTQPGVDAWVAAQFDVCPNKLSDGKYTDTAMAKKSAMLLGAAGFTPDLGDAIGAPFNTEEWAAILSIVQGGDIPTELAKVAAAQAEALAK